MSWHSKHFMDEARIAHYRGMRRRRQGQMAAAYQSFTERNLFMKLARGN